MAQSRMKSRPDPGTDAPLKEVERLRRREQQFEELLAAAEQRFAAPAEGADIAEWIDRGTKAFGALRPALQRARDEHRSALLQIAEEDLGLQPRIEEMQAAEGLLEQKEGELADQFTALQRRLVSGDADQSAWYADIARVAQEGLQWTSGVRAQHLAVHTWLNEALTRDRGVVD